MGETRLIQRVGSESLHTDRQIRCCVPGKSLIATRHNTCGARCDLRGPRNFTYAKVELARAIILDAFTKFSTVSRRKETHQFPDPSPDFLNDSLIIQQSGLTHNPRFPNPLISTPHSTPYYPHTIPAARTPLFVSARQRASSGIKTRGTLEGSS
ncbi:predicted protein [Botrytis cinerea T4]|uniref:Uncharacterized protein n=1 Tax=Botryotinia fuckeliana (strain T4) TaxID=999810 RepID=G2Y6L4_BOTF4|nr:predicted protein [Botrytis cinerea T4]